MNNKLDKQFLKARLHFTVHLLHIPRAAELGVLMSFKFMIEILMSFKLTSGT